MRVKDAAITGITAVWACVKDFAQSAKLHQPVASGNAVVAGRRIVFQGRPASALARNH